MGFLHVVMGSDRSDDNRTGQNARKSVKSTTGDWEGGGGRKLLENLRLC